MFRILFKTSRIIRNVCLDLENGLTWFLVILVISRLFRLFRGYLVISVISRIVARCRDLRIPKHELSGMKNTKNGKYVYNTFQNTQNHHPKHVLELGERSDSISYIFGYFMVISIGERLLIEVAHSYMNVLIWNRSWEGGTELNPCVVFTWSIVGAQKPAQSTALGLYLKLETNRDEKYWLSSEVELAKVGDNEISRFHHCNLL